MRGLLPALAQRREALVERCAAQRAAVAVAAGSVRRAAAEPLLLGLGVAVALASGSPRLRAWLVRAWVIGAFVRRLLR